MGLAHSRIAGCQVAFMEAGKGGGEDVPVDGRLCRRVVTLSKFGFFASYCFRFLSIVRGASVILPHNRLARILHRAFTTRFVVSNKGVLTLRGVLKRRSVGVAVHCTRLTPSRLRATLHFGPLTALPDNSGITTTINVAPWWPPLAAGPACYFCSGLLFSLAHLRG